MLSACRPLSSKPSRNPKWHVWAHVPKVEAWEAIALSLNIEPGAVKHHPQGWMADSANLMHLEGDDFKDRLEVLRRNLSSFNLVSIIMGSPDHCEIRPSEFAAWARGLGWSLPPELEALAKPSTPKPAPAPTMPDLSTAEKNSLLKLVIGMAVRGYSFDPAAAKSPVPNEIATDLDQLGIGLDPDTVRKYLREASALLPNASQGAKAPKR
jgi:hypothetical protein